MVSVPRTRPPYPESFRREAVALVRREGRSIRDVADSLGVSQQTLRTWVKQVALDAGERDDGLTSVERDELRELRRRVRRLEQEREILKQGGGLLRERDAVSCFRFIAAKKATFPISLLCSVLGVSRSGFHAWERRSPSPRVLSDAWLLERIRAIHARTRGVYGAPRVHAQLRHEGVCVGRKRVERLMREAGLSGLIKTKRSKTTIRVPGVRTAPDLVARDFAPNAPDRLWCADITYVRTWEGWLYLAAVIDCHSRRIVGWAMADHLRADLVVDALEMAIARRRPGPGLIHHSDAGSQPGLNRSSQQLVLAVNVSTAGDDWLVRAAKRA